MPASQDRAQHTWPVLFATKTFIPTSLSNHKHVTYMHHGEPHNKRGSPVRCTHLTCRHWRRTAFGKEIGKERQRRMQMRGAGGDEGEEWGAAAGVTMCATGRCGDSECGGCGMAARGEVVWAQAEGAKRGGGRRRRRRRRRRGGDGADDHGRVGVGPGGCVRGGVRHVLMASFVTCGAATLRNY